MIAALAVSLAPCGSAKAQQPALAAPAKPPAQLAVTIHADQTARPISRYEYGMFIENLGQLTYRTLWSQMLDDRKFYYPILPAVSHPASTGPAFFRGMQLRKWHPMGHAQSVTMDTTAPFVGEHSPEVQLDPTTPNGILQSGLSLVKGRHYTGYIYLRASQGAHVQVSLAWGATPAERQTVDLPPIPTTYTRLPFHFTAGADSSDATFQVSATGAGTLHIGTLSLMPSDNIDGFRPHVIALLRQIHSGFWRLPGGNFISDFNWYDSVGNIDTRPPFFDHAWNAVQSNDLGMDEYMTLCRLIGTTPYITVNAGFGDAHSAAEEVEYINGSTQTRLGAERARNGHPAPYNVKFWDIGNEPYGPWQLGHTALKYFVIKTNRFAAAMRKADPDITLLASGSMPSEMIIEGVAHAEHIPFSQVGICTPSDWTCGYLKHSWGNFSGVTEHWYARAGYRFSVAAAKANKKYPHVEAGYIPFHGTTLQWVRNPSNRVRIKAEEWEAYQKLFPAMKKKHIFMSIDEYAYTGAPANLKSAMAYAMVFNEMLRHTDFIRMSAFTMGVSTLNITPTAASINSTGKLFELYDRHMGPGLIPVQITGNSPQPLPSEHLFGDYPHKLAGSPTYPLDMVAALSPDRKFLSIAVVNATRTTQHFALNVDGLTLSGPSTLWRMTGPSLTAADDLGKPPQVNITTIHMDAVPRSVAVAPISIDIYRFPVQGAN
jgi:alpha-N-arabinofuranosidase